MKDVHSTINPAEEEIALIDAFVLSRRRERLRFLVATPHRRKDFLRELSHFKWQDPRRVRAIVPRAQNPDDVAALLESMGAPNTCFVVSEDAKLDRQQLPLL